MKTRFIFAIIGVTLVSEVAWAGSSACKIDKKDANNRPWETVGWRAEISAVADPGHFVEIRTTKEGLVFFETTVKGLKTHACDDLMTSDEMTSDDCSYLMQRGVAYPPKEIIGNARRWDRLLTYLKFITGSFEFAASNANLAYISAGVTTLNQIISPDPLGSFRTQSKLNKGLNEAGKCAILSQELNDHQTVVRIEPGVYDNGQGVGMRWDLKNILSGVYSKNEDRPEGVSDNVRLHTLVNSYIDQSKTVPSTTDSHDKQDPAGVVPQTPTSPAAPGAVVDQAN